MLKGIQDLLFQLAKFRRHFILYKQDNPLSAKSAPLK